ncbi:MAG TPA: TMEM165/GDT1 family protein [Chloroflexota bacterium]|nr:TMEM165/GDT1 family protein [Chloroflexota bacterium]
MFDISLQTVAWVFGVIFLAELPDKTALASLVLATKYRARAVILGAWLAFLVQTAVAVVAGSLLQLLPAKPVHIAAGLGFLVFAVLAFRRKEAEELVKEEAVVEAEQKRHVPAWLASFVVVFAAEWGDLTQLATAALVARTGETAAVAIGATAALWTVTVLAAVAGSQMSRFLTPAVLNVASGILFAIIGIIVIASALA